MQVSKNVVSQSSLQLFQQLPAACQDCQELGEDQALHLLATLINSGVNLEKIIIFRKRL